MGERIVVALGGNALGSSPAEQLALARKTAQCLSELAATGCELVVGHGNGPQVGMLRLATEKAASLGLTPDIPFAECGAMTQGYIGYHLQQALTEALRARKIARGCAAIITQVVVDGNDSAFAHPSKPIGGFYSADEARRIAAETGYTFVSDAGRGYRRVVPSPLPKRIVELELIEQLCAAGQIVIAAGGGGIPVVETPQGLRGVDAVIDKDRACALLARELKADRLIILTAVERVCLHYGTPGQIALDELSLSDCEHYLAAGEFAPGSMRPKIEACMDFVRGGGTAVIAALDKAADALALRSGTRIVPG